ncbi:antirestriction protein ArdA [Labrenzia suaedae]|uniref:Antirestriction protein ArdA n=2 Tax=Roseibium litorale TaxID=2803841 RepID=A0ABR9CUM9_9HYPH|nr:antirestriction protein ArdA [Roseibium litorale]
MVLFYAQPYDLAADGFYFENWADYQRKSAEATNRFGDRVEEFEIQFIDGNAMDGELAGAFGLSQGNLSALLEAIDTLDDHDKLKLVLAVRECGYRVETILDDPEAVEVDIYHLPSLRDLAEQFIEEGLFGDIPERLQYYIDYDAIAHDLAMDYHLAEVAGETLIYRCS